jgi:hypothetical protein
LVAEFAARGIAKDALLNTYYVDEALDTLARWRRNEARTRITAITDRLFKHWDERERDEYFDGLRKQAYGYDEDESDEFDADSLAAARAAFGSRF